MIYLAMSHIASELNQSLRRSSLAGEDIVVLANPVEADGKADGIATNKVILFLAGIERDTLPGRQAENQGLAYHAPTWLNVYVMAAANFPGRSYPDSLEYLSRVIAYFQAHPVFDRHSSPAMDEKIDKLILDMENLDRRELNNLWGMFGGKYMPSVLYRVRMLGIDADGVAGRRHRVAEPNIAVDPAQGN